MPRVSLRWLVALRRDYRCSAKQGEEVHGWRCLVQTFQSCDPGRYGYYRSTGYAPSRALSRHTYTHTCTKHATYEHNPHRGTRKGCLLPLCCIHTSLPTTKTHTQGAPRRFGSCTQSVWPTKVKKESERGESAESSSSFVDTVAHVHAVACEFRLVKVVDELHRRQHVERGLAHAHAHAQSVNGNDKNTRAQARTYASRRGDGSCARAVAGRALGNVAGKKRTLGLCFFMHWCKWTCSQSPSLDSYLQSSKRWPRYSAMPPKHESTGLGSLSTDRAAPFITDMTYPFRPKYLPCGKSLRLFGNAAYRPWNKPQVYTQDAEAAV